MNRLFLPFSILMVFQAVHISLRACCVSPPIEDSYIDADVIFYGKLIERRVDPYLTDKSGNNFLIDRYEVYEFFKGLPEDYPHAWVDAYKQPYIVSVITHVGKAEIRSIKSFEPNKKYLLYLKEGSLGLLMLPDSRWCDHSRVVREPGDWEMQELRTLKKMYVALTQDNKDQVKSDNGDISEITIEDLPPPPPPPPTYYEPFDEVSVLLDNLKFEAAFYKLKEHRLWQQQMALLVISSLLFALLIWALDRRRGV